VQLADNVGLHTWTDDALQALAARARGSGVTLEAGGRGLTADNLQRHLAVATRLGSWMLRFVIDGPGYEPTAAEVVALLRRHLPALRDAGVVLALENHDRFKAAELADLVAACESPWVGICFDTANSFGAGEDTLSALRCLAPHTVNVHLKDVSIRRVPSQQGFLIEGAPLGEGNLPLDEVISTLARTERCRTATLEHWVPPEPAFADTLLKEETWCARSTARLRTWFPASFAVSVP
jgi:sugar phosphate isomerase/epimerase